MDFIAYIVPALAISLLMVFGISYYDCQSYGSMTGRDVKTSFGTCYVKTEKGYIPRDELNYRAATHE